MIYIEDIPIEILKKIFSYLSIRDIIRCESVCKLWFDVSKSFWYDKTAIRFVKITNMVGGIVYGYNISVDIFCADKLMDTIVQVHRSYNSDEAFKYCIRRTGSNLEKIVIDIPCFDSEITFLYMIENCPNLRSISLYNFTLDNAHFKQSLSFCQLFTLKNLSEFKINNFRREARLFTVENFNTQSFKSQITHLHLQDLKEPFTETNFISLCQFVGLSLENFCFKYNEIDLEVLSKGFDYLKQLKHLNLSDAYYDVTKKSECYDYSLHLNDKFLLTLCLNCSNLESLNLKGNNLITTEAVNHLIQICTNLQLLSLINCHSVDDGLYRSLENRSTNRSELIIFAYDSGVTSRLVQRSTESSNWRVILEKSCDYTEFYGEEEIEDSIDEDINDENEVDDSFSAFLFDL